MHRFRLWWAKFLIRTPFIDRTIVSPLERTVSRSQSLLGRRPHRTLRRTRRRDYVRSLKLPGYMLFTWLVNGTLRKHKKTFLGLAVMYAILSGVLVGIGSQDTFSQLAGLFQGNELFSSGWGHIGQSGLLFVATVTHNVSNPNPSGIQLVFSFLLIILVWLTTVWLLRMQLAGKSPRLRDGLYSAGAPIVAMTVIVGFAVVQLLPVAIGLLTAGVLNGYDGALAMLVWLLAAALSALSLYWLTSTFFAAIIITLPGVYPWQAMRAASDLVVGRRVRVLLRLIWAILTVAISWLIIMTPIILLDIWLGSVWKIFASIPVVPFMLLLLSSLSLVWLATYVYMLYRRIVDDDAAPA